VSASDLVVRLETPLPASLPAGRADAVFCLGHVAHAPERIAEFALMAGGAVHRPDAWGLPRADAAGEGFWGTVPVPARAPGALELGVRARTESGAVLEAPLGRIAIAPPDPPPSLGRPAPPGLIAVCMATFEPDMDLFRAQVASLREQTDERWVCVISDDGSAPERFAEIAGTIAGDDRFVLSGADERLGFYRNFERALRMAPAEADLIALCDQDDRWYPEKLATLRGALGAATMVYSDQRLVDADGRVLRETLWRGRSNNHTDLVSMLVANSVTGAAALFRRDVAELALPFPDTPGMPFHDHWLGLVALAAGDVRYVDAPLYDYVQHRGAFFGAVTHGDGGGDRRPRLRSGRAAYFRGYLPRAVLARILLARCGDRMTEAKRRGLRRFVAAERSPPAAAWLAARPLRTRKTTLGSELELVPGLAWRRLARPLRRDASLPDVLGFQQRRLRRWRADV
jgi:glycosyltransferase involved in cell wall biosynthesis